MDLLLFDETEAKTKFAEMSLRNASNSQKEYFEIARHLTKDVGIACRIANEWCYDPFVVAKKNELVAKHGKKAFLIPKEDFANEIIDVARKASDISDKHKMYRLYAETQGLIEKPTTNINNNIQNVSNRVMVIKDSGSDAEWAEKLRLQQERLVNESSVR